jgi:hypothetical protein
MAAEPGGIASKLGTAYERQYAITRLLRMISGEITRLRWEPVSGERAGPDLEVVRVDGSVEHIQTKRQNGSDYKWSVAALAQEGVWEAAARVTDSSPRNIFTFVSSDPVPHLKDICDQLRRSSDSSAEFIRTHVDSNKERRACFDKLLSHWGFTVGNSSDEARAIGRLRAMRFELMDRGFEGEERQIFDVQTALTGDPERVIAQLSQFLEGHLGKDVSAQELLEHLKSLGIRPRDLARDRSLPTALLKLREEFQSSLRERLVAGTWMGRPEVAKVIEHVTGESATRVLIVHGKPGAGKSGVLLGVTDGLIERGIPFLPLSLSNRPPEGSVLHYGESLGLHATPSAALSASAGNRRTVLLLDQLDALRLTTSGAAATWQICAEMIREAIFNPELVIVVACRTFDLENDASIRRWRESIERTSAGKVVSIEVGDFKPTDLQPILHSIKVAYESLPPRVQKLLLHPNTLDAWYRLARRGSARRDFSTQTQLIETLIEALRKEAVLYHNVLDRDVYEVLNTARESMERSGKLIAPASSFDRYRAALEACRAVGLLVRSGGSVSFPHQSYFDHLAAKAALADSGHSPPEIVRWMKRDQSLERRDQLRQLLFMLRDEDSGASTQVMESVLRDPGIRFHLKHLVCGVLREAGTITSEDIVLVSALAVDDRWTDHVISRVLWRSVPWFDALYSAGVWPRLLKDSAGDRRAQWLRTILMIMEQRPAEVDQLLQPILAEPDGTEILGRALWFDPSEDSPAVAELRDRQIRAGRWVVRDYVLDKVARTDPKRVVRLVESAVRGLLRRRLTAISSRSDERIESMREGTYEREVASAVTAHAAESYPAFSRLLRLVERLDRSARTKINSLDDFDAARMRTSSFFAEVREILITLTAHAVAGLADVSPEKLREVLASKQLRTSRALSIAVTRGLVGASDSASDAALVWLRETLERVENEGLPRRDKHGLAADVIRRHARTCTDSTLLALESRLLRLHPEGEKESYRSTLEYLCNGEWGYSEGGRYHAYPNPIGRAQHLLLGAIPEERRSFQVRDRLRQWDSKFGGAAIERARHELRGGLCSSPIPSDRISRLTDREWIKIVSQQWPLRRPKQIGPDRIVESSSRHFANDLGQAAKAAPRRFVLLALQFPAGVPSVYLSRLCDALADRNTSVESCDLADLNALLVRILDTGDRDAIMSACSLIEHHPLVGWGEPAWTLLEHAAAHKDPDVREFTTQSIQGTGAHRDLESISLNSVRGSAASALAELAWEDVKRAVHVLPIAKRLAADPHPAVRLAAAKAAYGVYLTNKDEGLSLLLAIVDHADDRVLIGHWVSRLVQYIRWSHPGVLQLVFRRMIESDIPEVVEQGAQWVTAEFHQFARCEGQYADCRNGDAPHRVGVATMLGFLLCDQQVDATRVETELAQLFNDTAPEVRAAASRVLLTERALSPDSVGRVASSFVTSVAFAEHSTDLLHVLSRLTGSLVPFASTVLAAADRFANELADQTRSVQNRLGMSGGEVSSLLLRLYDAAVKSDDRSLANECLDRWDALLASRVGDAEAHLDSFVE